MPCEAAGKGDAEEGAAGSSQSHPVPCEHEQQLSREIHRELHPRIVPER